MSHFRSDEEVLTAVEEWVNGKDPDFFSSGLMPLEHRWRGQLQRKRKGGSQPEISYAGYLLTLPRKCKMICAGTSGSILKNTFVLIFNNKTLEPGRAVLVP